MSRHVKHTIGRQQVEVEFLEMEDAFGVQDKIAVLCKEKLNDRLNRLFDEVAGERYLIALDELVIDCGTINEENWEEELTNAVVKNIEAKLVTINRKRVDDIADNDYYRDIFYHFLEKGYLPWNADTVTLKLMEDKFELTASSVTQLKKIFTANKNSAARLSYNFTGAFCEKILRAFAKEFKIDLVFSISVRNQLKLADPVFYTAAINSCVHTDAHYTYNENFNAEILSQLPANLKEQLQKTLLVSCNDIKPLTAKMDSDKTKEPGNNLSLYINNAGLILVHPFIQQLFNETGLLTENRWSDQSSVYKAVRMLEYITDGINELQEHQLSLNKILCGLPVDEVIKFNEPLEDIFKNECDQLLNAVIGYWDKLKSTSPEAFRETFIRRNGKLSMTDGGWLVQVEQKSVDILLESLPWGIGYVKLPWMKEAIYTEWN